MPLTYSVPEAAQLLGINRNTAYEAAARGELPVIKIGKRLLIPRAKFDAMLSGTASE
jgi:excisionase family DNA binding protein